MRTNLQDPTYYYPDGAAVFLVEDTLFKLQPTLILRPGSIPPPAMSGARRYAMGIENISQRLAADCTDANPITLHNTTANQFRNYLFAVLGKPSDLGYLELFVDATNPTAHSPELLARYLDIAFLSYQFGMAELEEWAASQLELVLESRHALARENWDKDTLLRLNFYARSNENQKLISNTTTFLQYFISISTVPELWGPDPKHASSNLETCVELYNDLSLCDEDPVLFGCVFAAILSQGHRSQVWNSMISEKDRQALYAAQVQLTCLSNELKHVGWIQSPPQLAENVCPSCQPEFLEVWQGSMVTERSLETSAPLRGVTALARLPQRRRLLQSQWKKCIRHRDPEFSSDKSQTTSSMQGSAGSGKKPGRLMKALRGQARMGMNSPAHIERCTELDWLSDHVEYHIQLVYQELAHRHMHKQSTSRA